MPEPRRRVRRGRVADAVALERPRTRLAARKLKEENQVGEEEEEKEVMAIGNDSGGSNKAAAQEEEGNTAPFPERVKAFSRGDNHFMHSFGVMS